MIRTDSTERTLDVTASSSGSVGRGPARWGGVPASIESATARIVPVRACTEAAEGTGAPWPIATTVATILSFLGNKHWAFRHRKGNALHRESILFFVCNGVGLLFQLAFVAAVQFGLGLKGTLAYNVANILGVMVATLFRLYTYRRWVFLMAGGEPVDAEHLQPEISGT